MHQDVVTDALFERAARQLVEKTGCEKAFYSKVAGASHPNADGSSRTRAIAECNLFEALELQPEPDNPFDPDAVKIVRLKGGGEQLGYVEASLATEVARDFRRFGPCWLALFRHPDVHPETGRVVGAVLYMLRLPAERLSAEDAPN